MDLTPEASVVTFIIIAILGFVLGRISVRALGNALMGGTLFGGDPL